VDRQTDRQITRHLLPLVEVTRCQAQLWRKLTLQDQQKSDESDEPEVPPEEEEEESAAAASEGVHTEL